MTGQFIVAEIKQVFPIQGADKIVRANLFGETVIISKDTTVGTKGILIDTESVLSHEICQNLNLYRHSTLNKDTKQVGYIEDNRRVRPIRLKGVKCSGLFLTEESLKEAGITSLPKVGTQANELEGIDVCKKFVNEKTRQASSGNKQGKARRKDLVPTFKEHLDTEQWARNHHVVDDGDLIIISEKLHGTSGRAANLPALQQLKWYEKVLDFLGINIQKSKYTFIAGSRRVVKSIDGQDEDRVNITPLQKWCATNKQYAKYNLDAFREENNINSTTSSEEIINSAFGEKERATEEILNNVDFLQPGFKDWYVSKEVTNDFYDNDIWTKAATSKFKDKLRKGETVYFEIVGFGLNKVPIMGTHSNEKLKPFLDKKEYKDFIKRYGDDTVFSYGCNQDDPDNLYEIYVYRITTTNEDGDSIDLSWGQVKGRCEQMGVKHVPELKKVVMGDDLDLLKSDLISTVTQLAQEPSREFPQHLREGVVVRIENKSMTPKCFKEKSYAFKVLEGIIKESDQADIEEAN